MDKVETISNAIDAAKNTIEDNLNDPLIKMLQDDFEDLDVSVFESSDNEELLKFIELNFYDTDGKLKSIGYQQIALLLSKIKKVKKEKDDYEKTTRSKTHEEVDDLDKSKINEALSGSSDPLLKTLVGDFDNFNLSPEDKKIILEADNYLLIVGLLNKYQDAGISAYTSGVSNPSGTGKKATGGSNTEPIAGVATNGVGILSMGQHPENFSVDETDFSFYSSIDERIEEASLEDLDDISKKITDIKIDSPNLDQEDWDHFFDDLESALDESEEDAFKDFVKSFKETPMYLASARKSEGGVGGDEADIKPWYTKDGAEQRVKGISESVESFGNGFGLNIDRLGRDIDGLVDEINEMEYEEGNNINISLGGIDYLVTSKKEALLMLYRGKLILSELDKTDLSTMGVLMGYVDYNMKAAGLANDVIGTAWQAPSILGVAGGGIAALLLYGGLAGANAIVIGGPLESVYRNTIDWISIRFGGSTAAEAIAPLGNGAKNIDGWIKKMTTFKDGNGLTVKTVKSIGKILRIITAPTAKIIGGAGTLVDKATAQTLETTMESQKINIIDGLGSADGDPASHKFEEIRRRYQILDFYKKKWADDPTRIKKLEKLEKADKIGGGQLISDSDTFYIKIQEIDKGQLILTGEPLGRFENSPRLDRAANVAHGTVYQTAHVFSFHRREPDVVRDVNTTIKNQKSAMKEIFESIEKDGDTTIDYDKPTEFHDRIVGFIDLDSTISNDAEIAREGIMKDYINMVKNLELQGISDVQIKKDLYLIAKEGFYPKAMITKKISQELNKTEDKKIKTKLQAFKNQVHSDKWLGGIDDLKGVFQDISSGRDLPADVERDVKQSDIDELTKKGSALRQQKFDTEQYKTAEDFRNAYKVDLDLSLMSGELVSTDHFDREMNALYASMKSRNIGGEKTRANDYTEGHVNYIKEQILAGKTFKSLSGAVDEDIFKDEILASDGKYRNDTELRQKRRNAIISEKADVVDSAGNVTGSRNIGLKSEVEVLKSLSGTDLVDAVKELNERYFNPINDNPELKRLFSGSAEYKSLVKTFGILEKQNTHLNKVRNLLSRTIKAPNLAELNAVGTEYEKYISDNLINTDKEPFAAEHKKFEEYYNKRTDAIHKFNLKGFITKINGADGEGLSRVRSEYNEYVAQNNLSTASGEIGKQKDEVDKILDVKTADVRAEKKSQGSDGGYDSRSESSGNAKKEAQSVDPDDIRKVGEYYNLSIRHADLTGNTDLAVTLNEDRKDTLRGLRKGEGITDIEVIRGSILADIGLDKFPTAAELDALEADIKAAALKKEADKKAEADRIAAEEAEKYSKAAEELNKSIDRAILEVPLHYGSDEIYDPLNDLRYLANEVDDTTDNFKGIVYSDGTDLEGYVRNYSELTQLRSLDELEKILSDANVDGYKSVKEIRDKLKNNSASDLIAELTVLGDAMKKAAGIEVKTEVDTKVEADGDTDVDSDTETKEQTPESKEGLANAEKVNQYISLYDRAIMEAELLGNTQYAEKLLEIKNGESVKYMDMVMSGNREIEIDIDAKKAELEATLGTKIRGFDSLNDNFKALQKLVDDGLIEVRDGVYMYVSGKSKKDLPEATELRRNMIKYIGKAIKSGG